ncbi:hypothetical protein [Paenibacillus turpanensis]|uniref:hypothetical protein n=1 Tax=Paenibacillus turpanensis TaxID=2689078 RepID=UPI00140812EB|nr:hypothetical protein [Paenibacillus turpanensis]
MEERNNRKQTVITGDEGTRYVIADVPDVETEVSAGLGSEELPEPEDHRLYDDLAPAVRPSNQRDMEAAAELTGAAPLIQPEDDRPADIRRTNAQANAGALDQNGAMMGWLALVLAIASLFVWPSVLGPSAIVVGFISYVRGTRALGVWSMVLGLISFVTFLAILNITR